MALQQEQLPELGEHFYNFAEAASINRLGELPERIKGIDVNLNGIVIVHEASEEAWPMPGLVLLSEINKLDKLRLPASTNTRRNVVTVSRLGGAAVIKTAEEADEKGIEFSPAAMIGINRVTGAIYSQLDKAFRPITRKEKDHEALYWLGQIGRSVGRIAK